MERLKKMDWATLKHEYDLDAKRLLPWDGFQAPFGGAWCVVRAGTRSLPHDHDEREMFICVSGRATVHQDESSVEVAKGDVVFIEPGRRHYVENSSGQDFHMYSIWWDDESAESYLGDGRRDRD